MILVDCKQFGKLLQMKFRELKDKDLEKLSELNKMQDFCLRNRGNKIVDGVIENSKGNVIAYGIVKRQSEAVILLDKSKPILSRAKALRELMKVAIFGARRENCQQLICAVKDPKVVELLKKHFGFIESKDRILVLNL